MREPLVNGVETNDVAGDLARIALTSLLAAIPGIILLMPPISKSMSALGQKRT